MVAIEVLLMAGVEAAHPLGEVAMGTQVLGVEAAQVLGVVEVDNLLNLLN